MNVFHWHISDNCIFSIESKVYVLSCGVVVQLPAYIVYSIVVPFRVDTTVCYNLYVLQMAIYVIALGVCAPCSQLCISNIYVVITLVVQPTYILYLYVMIIIVYHTVYSYKDKCICINCRCKLLHSV